MELDLIMLNKKLKEKAENSKITVIETPKVNLVNKMPEEKLIVISKPQEEIVGTPQQESTITSLETIDEEKKLKELQEKQNIEIEYMKFKYEKEIEDLKQFYEEQMALKVKFMLLTKRKHLYKNKYKASELIVK